MKEKNIGKKKPLIISGPSRQDTYAVSFLKKPLQQNLVPKDR